MAKWALLLAFLAIVSCSGKPVYPEAPHSDGSVRIPLSALPEANPVFYSFVHGRSRIDFFVLKAEGSVESYFDACVKCYPKKLGYRVHESRLACRACDVEYPRHALKEGIGSCYPIKLPGIMEGGFYVIGEKAILAGAKLY